MTKTVLGTLCLYLFCACGPGIIYEESQTFPPTGWDYTTPANFRYHIEDTSKTYDLTLGVTHSSDFAYQNFYVRLYTTLPAGTIDTQLLSLQLAGEFGAWQGNCATSECTLTIPLISNLRYQVPGPYSLTVEQYSRDNPLIGIYGLKARVLEHQNTD
ncbi:MAG: gliding motility lipoprotein GldH [Bacteroidota bacterium]